LSGGGKKRSFEGRLWRSDKEKKEQKNGRRVKKRYEKTRQKSRERKGQ